MCKNLKKIDSATKKMLLKWLCAGEIDVTELSSLNANYTGQMTDEEIQTELDRLSLYLHADQCERLQRLGYCKYFKKN